MTHSQPSQPTVVHKIVHNLKVPVSVTVPVLLPLPLPLPFPVPVPVPVSVPIPVPIPDSGFLLFQTPPKTLKINFGGSKSGISDCMVKRCSIRSRCPTVDLELVQTTRNV